MKIEVKIFILYKDRKRERGQFCKFNALYIVSCDLVIVLIIWLFSIYI